MTDIPITVPKRCAIYTRKSTNIRLDREINSLTTQHEICSAYVASQSYRGWTEIPKRYDDGGHSGSGLERPALAGLMHDIEAGEVDTVIVYKIDRLTRSLLDFVRLIEIFDRRSIWSCIGFPSIRHRRQHGADDSERVAHFLAVRARADF